MLQRAGVEPGDAELARTTSRTRGPRRTRTTRASSWSCTRSASTGGYTQQDIVEVARCFTGWRYITTTGDPHARTFLLQRQNVHDNGDEDGARHTRSRSAGVNEGDARAADPRRASGDGAVRREEAAALVHRLRAVARRSSTDVAEAFRQSGGDIKTVVKRACWRSRTCRWAPPLFKRPFHYMVSAPPRDATPT